MKLWNVDGKSFGNCYEWRSPVWTVLLYDISDPETECAEAWVWQLSFRRFQLASVGPAYTTARGAKLGLERAVKRLGLRVGKRRKRG